ncbi:hypothetical protein AADZ90_010635 [Aestuariibius sp. 2305UL40-4]|uniref:hypothetical protein n=1 Tax=Aestuariibius violaceus TaxID=3234132 RepID=UPI00347AD9AE
MRKMMGTVFVRSHAETRRRRAMLVIMLFGGLIAHAVVRHLNQAPLETLEPYDYWTILSGMIGAVIAYRTAEGHLGLPGVWGAVRAFGAGIWITLAGAVIGGTLVLPGFGTMFGPLSVIVTLIEAPVLLVLWAATIFGAHRTLHNLRFEMTY